MNDTIDRTIQPCEVCVTSAQTTRAILGTRQFTDCEGTEFTV